MIHDRVKRKREKKRKVDLKCITRAPMELKIKKKYKINYDTSLKSYDHANFKSGAWKHI